MPDPPIRGTTSRVNNQSEQGGESNGGVGGINEKIARLLLELGDYENKVTRQRFKYVAYRKAAGAVARHPSPIRSGEDAKRLEGVGDTVAKQIDEIVKTGTLHELEQIRDTEPNCAIKEMTQVFGIGPAHAQALYVAGFTSIEDLRHQPAVLTPSQQVGLKYHEEFQQPILREEQRLMEIYFKRILKQLDSRYTATFCGAYRRGADHALDLNICLTHPSYVSQYVERGSRGRSVTPGRSRNRARAWERGWNEGLNPPGSRVQARTRSRSRSNQSRTRRRNRSLSLTRAMNEYTGLLDQVVAKFKETGFITDTLDQGKTKFMGACALNDQILAELQASQDADLADVHGLKDPSTFNQFMHRRINIRLVPQDQYWCGVLHMTGSPEFLRRIRYEAEKQGFIFSEYGLRKILPSGKEREPLPVYSEKDIFDYLGMDYVKPEDRNDTIPGEEELKSL